MGLLEESKYFLEKDEEQVEDMLVCDKSLSRCGINFSSPLL